MFDNGSVPGNIVNNATLTFANPSAQTYNDAISGSGALIKIGAGTLTLSGSNTYTGPTTVNGGDLVYTSLSACGSGLITINSPGTLTGAYTTVAGWIQSGLINQASTGVLLVSGSDSGNVNLTGYNSLSLGAVAGGATFSGSLTPANGIYNLGGGDVLTVTTALTGGNNLLANNTLILAGSVSYTGPTTISAGVLVLTNNSNQTLSGSISGSGALVWGGTGTLVLSSTNNVYTGGTTIGSGKLQIGDGSTSPGSLPGNVVINSLAGALTFDTPAGMSLTASGNISGTGGLTKIGGGTLLLTGTNSYSGGTTVSGGTLQLGTSSAIGSSGLAVVRWRHGRSQRDQPQRIAFDQRPRRCSDY